mgnify:CR=1 FL=1
MYQKNHKAWYKHIDFMLLDFLCIELSFIITVVLRFGMDALVRLFNGEGEFLQYNHIMLAIAILHIVLLFFTELYSGVLKRNAAEEFRKLFAYNLYFLAGLVMFLFAEQSSVSYSRFVIFAFPVINCIFMFLCHYALKNILRQKINKDQNQDCMLLVAPYSQIHAILHRFYKNKISTVRIVGIILADQPSSLEAAAALEMGNGKVIPFAPNGKELTGTKINGIPVVGTLADMYEYARTNVVDEVLICMEHDCVEEIADAFIGMGITVHVSIQNLVQIPRATVNRVNGISVITASVNMVTARQLMIKRMIDIFFGFFGSVITVLLTIVIAPMIWIADPGPVFFRQERVGKNGRTFKIWKFRTMYQDAEARKAELMKHNKMNGLMFKMDDDPRIIGYGKRFSIGKFLREYSIDELPQSFNILAGSMSVVGTRPPTLQEYEQYELHHKGRLATKPGLTGMWQISGRSDITDFEEVVRLDKEYIDNFSLSLDLEIILKTFKVVLGKEGSV